MKIFNLLKIELFKESKRTIHYIFLFLLILSSFLTIYFSNKNYRKEDIVEYEVIEKISKNEYNHVDYDSNYDHYSVLLKEYNQDIIKENKIIEYTNNHNLKEKIIFEKVITISLFISLIITITISSIMSNEINKGTIKLLIPAKRFKILISKILCSLIICFIYALVLLISMILFMKVICDVNVLSFNTYNNLNYFGIFIIKYFINIVPVLFISILVVVLSCLFRNVALTSGFLIFLSLFGSTISSLLLSIKMKFIEYTFLPYLDLSVLHNKEELFYMNVNFNTNLCIKNGIIILLIYSIIFVIISSIYYSKKDITN